MPSLDFVNDSLISVGEKVRIERGPLLKTATASAALFESGELADHYKLGALDKLGAVIVDGQEFSYLDWRGPHAWHVYELVAEEWAGPEPKWRRRGAYETQAEAVSAATVIAQTYEGAA